MNKKKILLSIGILLSILIIAIGYDYFKEYEILREPISRPKIFANRLSEIDYARKLSEVEDLPRIEDEEIEKTGGYQEILDNIMYEGDRENAKHILRTNVECKREIKELSKFTCKNDFIAERHEDKIRRKKELIDAGNLVLTSKMQP